MMSDDPVAGSPVLAVAPVPKAAALWRDQPDLFDRLRRRLTSYAPNTQRALAADWRRWRAWCARCARPAFPARPPDLVDYLLAHSPALEQDAAGTVSLAVDVNGGNVKRASTVSRWLASLSTLHRIAEVADPTRDEDVKATRRTLARGRGLPEQKAPLRWLEVSRALATLGASSRDLRAKALIAVAYSTLARRAELIALKVEDLTFSAEGDGTATLRTKGGHIHERYLAPEARVAVETWLDQAGIESGPVFRRLERHGGTGDRTITTAEVARTFKRIAALIGLDPTSVSRISAHSTRIGAAQDLTASGAALPEIMLAGGWKSPQMPTHYARKLDAKQGAMQQWLEKARRRDAGDE
jgi:integrase/recombinase XerD